MITKDNSETKKIVAEATRLVQPIIDGNDYHAIALFTPAKVAP